MQISRINNVSYNYNFSNNPYLKQLYKRETPVYPSFSGASAPIKHTSFYFRNDLDWVEFGKYIKNKFKNDKKVNTYVWGCSNGMEPYSLAILMSSFSGGSKFLPIKAMDISSLLISQNKKEQKEGVELTEENYERISVNLLLLGYNSTLNFLEVPKSWEIGSKKIKKNITSKVEFSHSDILKDINKIDKNNPSIVMCRNMWPYIDCDKYDECAKNMYDNLKEGSVVVIGGYDIDGSPYIKKSSTFRESLQKAGFKPVNRALGLNRTKCCTKNNRPSLIYEK